MLTTEAASIFIWIVFTHWIADFIFQDEKWANAKSTSFKALVTHTIVYSFMMTIMWMFYFEQPFKILYFFLITFVTHTITDFFTSKIVKRKFKNQNYGSGIPNFGAFTLIGLDQVIHYITITFSILFLEQI